MARPLDIEPEKEQTRASWDRAAEGYLKAMRLFEPYGFDLLARVDPKIRESGLDIATGPGAPALSMARMVGPEGRVVGIDLSEKMVGLATRIAKERRIPNIEFWRMDAEAMDFPDESFDLATSRFGFEIFPHPEVVAKETLRVLRPRGRIGVAVWSTADKATALEAVVSATLEHIEPDETGYRPTPFELGGPGELAKLLEAAGFQEAREFRRTHAMAFRDEDEYVERMVVGTPLGDAIRDQEPALQKKILARTRQNLRAWKKGRRLEIPCEGVVVTAHK